MVVSYSVYFSRKKGQNSSKAKFHVSLPFVRFDISIINIVNIMWYDIGISMEVDTVRIFLEKRFFHASFVQCSMQMGMNFLFQFRIRFVRNKVVPSYFLESTRGYYVSCYVHRWTPCRCAISVRNKVTCNSLVICNAPPPRSLEINSCNTIRSYRETSSCLARASWIFSRNVRKNAVAPLLDRLSHSKVDTSATYGSFLMKNWIYDGGNWFDVG